MKRVRPGDKVRLAVADHPGTGKDFRVKDYNGLEATVWHVEKGRCGLVTVYVDGRRLYLDRGSLC